MFGKIISSILILTLGELLSKLASRLYHAYMSAKEKPLSPEAERLLFGAYDTSHGKSFQLEHLGCTKIGVFGSNPFVSSSHASKLAPWLAGLDQLESLGFFRETAKGHYELTDVARSSSVLISLIEKNREFA